MTDENLMDAECVHGIVWYDCEVCVEDMKRFFKELEAEELRQPNFD